MIPFSDVVQPTIKLKVKRTTAFLQVKPQDIRLRVKPQFPAQVVGGTGISVSVGEGTYTIDLKISELQEVTSAGSNAYVVVWDSATNQFARIKTGNI